MIPGSANPLLLASASAAAAPVQIERSLRFNSADSAYLSRTPAVAGDRRTWTWAGWVKRSAIGSGTRTLFDATLSGGGTENPLIIGESVDDTLSLYLYNGSSYVWQLRTTQVFRDPSAWYHVLVAVDTTQSTASDRIKFFINGTQVTTFAVSTYPSLNADTYINNNTAHAIGSKGAGVSSLYSGCLADIHFISGQALDPSSFTEVSATTGRIEAKLYAGSFGTNGFWLPFNNNSTAAALGTDYSGNSNTWTVNNLSVTAGAGNDSLVDTPTSISATDTGVGGEVRGNYATLNPLDNGGQTLANGNLDITGIASNWRGTRGTIGMSSGKWYWEVTISFTNSGSNQSLLGIATNAASISGNYASAGAYGWEYYSNNGNKFNNGSNPGYGASYTSGDVIGIAFDADSGALTFYKNGSSQGTAYTGLTSGPYFPSFSLYGTSLVSFNAGQRAFAYTAPSGFKALCDTNLPAPVVAKPNTVMDAVLYTANVDGGKTISMPGGFSPDLVWIKNRDNTERHYLIDKVRGNSTFLNSNTTDSESGATLYLANTTLTLDNSAYTITDSSWTSGELYYQNRTYVSWCWDAGTSTVSNTSGSITSQVRANVSAGFSVVSFTGQSAAGTVGHGLGVAPAFIITKTRDSGAQGWNVYHRSLGKDMFIALNSTNAAASAPNHNGTSEPTSQVYGITSSSSYNNRNGEKMISYCFAPVAGYSSFGSYTGTSAAQFVYLGFRPKFWMHKISNSTGSWMMLDSSRDPYNVVGQNVYANLTNTESTYSGGALDFVSNGVVLRSTGNDVNGSGNTYLYIAFAENPFQYARAR
jgi:hypothetical protein